VITLGRSATPDHILDARGITVERIERGGQVTYHGPGQLMIYPVVRLRGGGRVPPRRIARAIAETCAVFGVPGRSVAPRSAGVWLDDKKIAACGIHVSRSVAIHGFAFNIDTPPEAWRTIRPCGLDVPLVSLRQRAVRARRRSAWPTSRLNLATCRRSCAMSPACVR